MNENLPLPAFDKENYTVHTRTVRTATGVRTVTYHYYRRVQYCAKPVDVNYQCMNIKVPVEIDGVSIDTSNAPILLNILVGGYFSVLNSEETPVKDSPFTPDGGTHGGRPEPYRPQLDDKDEIALAHGFVIVTPGVRGWNCVRPDGTMFGNAPSVIVDFKAAIRYLRHNRDIIPGNPDRILTSGGSAGGAVSCLLGATGNDPLYAAYLDEIGAADERDDIFAVAAYSPITNLDNADGAYEWMFGTLPRTVPYVTGPKNPVLEPCDIPEDQAASAELRALWAEHLARLSLRGRDGEAINAENLGEYLTETYLCPSASAYLSERSPDEQKEYLVDKPWLKWDGGVADFTFADYAAHCGRMKPLPAFDTYNLSAPENNVFGTETVRARHFTNFSLQKATGDSAAELPADLVKIIGMMNPMNYTGAPGCCDHWWIKHGASDPHTAVAVPLVLAIKLENEGKDVHASAPWDGWHRADDDPQGVIDWMCSLSGWDL